MKRTEKDNDSHNASVDLPMAREVAHSNEGFSTYEAVFAKDIIFDEICADVFGDLRCCGQST
jgi:hypothetical protein